MEYEPDTEGIEYAEDIDLFNATEDSIIDNFGAEELGIALGLAEEIAIDYDDERRAKEDRPISIEENKRLKNKINSNKKVKASWFEAWVSGVIQGEIDPEDPYPDISLPSHKLDDPM